tara:strand:+ start:83 stop:334 length:252 start_codon:yes stop_codon:yes gene_type:complete
MPTPNNNPTQTTPNSGLYDVNMGETMLNISAANRKFQNSIIVTQDVTKEGVLSFLKDAEESRPTPYSEQMPQTMRPGQTQGGY